MLGRDEWHFLWTIIWLSLLFAFLVPLLWSTVRVVRLLRALGWEVRAAVVQTQAITHFLTLFAAFLRVCLVSLEQTSVANAEAHNDQMSKTMNAELIIFSLFFPTTAGLYLSLLQYWQVNIDGLHETMDPAHVDPYRPMVAPWRMLGPVRSVMALYFLECIHVFFVLVVKSAIVEMIFIFWGVCVTGVVAICSVFTARRLHALVRELAPYSTTDSLFKKLLVGPSLIAIFALGALVLTIVESLNAQYYAWPHLLFWTIGRGLEAATLTVALVTIGDMRPPPPNTAASFSEGSTVPQHATTPTELMSMALAGMGGPGGSSSLTPGGGGRSARLLSANSGLSAGSSTH